MINLNKKLLQVILLLISGISCAFACTGIQLKANDGTYINGRTVEFGRKITASVLIVPRNYQFSGTLPSGEQGLQYVAKYAVIGADMDASKTISDGLNEQGLSVGSFYFPGEASYTAVTKENQAQALAPLEFPNWLLTQFATVDEVRQNLDKIIIVPTVFKSWGFVPPFHYVVYDKTGKSIVIEPINGKLTVYDNPLGVITNSPTFDWHLTNLRNYINLTAQNVASKNVDGIDLKQFGEGSGMHGLPGDFTPPSRFVRAAIFSSTAKPAENSAQTVLQVFHILNQFDIPLGIAKSMHDGNISYDYTLYTTAKDPQNLIYFIRSYDDQNIKQIRFSEFDLDAKEIKMITLGTSQQIVDISKEAVKS